MDRKKVINALQDAVNDDWMWQHADYYATAMKNAIALLKEQEPKQVIGIADFTEGIEVGYCPSCGRGIVNKKINKTKYCKFCGQAVAWDD